MAAKSKKTQNNFLLTLSVFALVLLVAFFALTYKKTVFNMSPTGTKPSPTAKSVVRTENTVSQAVNGPIGRNLLTAKSGPKKGEVTLSWTRYYSDRGSYSVIYRSAPGKYTYGVLNVADSSSKSNTYTYTVGSLQSGTTYNFAIEVMQTNSKAEYVSPEVSVVAP